MPYFIEDDHPNCAGWATVKEDGELMGCHDSKQAAINQALAIAQAEGSTFEGERNLDELLEDAPGGGLPDNYRPATSDDVPEGRACGNCVFFNEENLDAEGRAWCEWWQAYAAGGFYCNAWRGAEGRPYHDDEDEDRVAPDAVEVGDYVSWDSAGGRARGRITRIIRSGTLNVPDTDFTLNADEDNPAALIRVYQRVRDGWEPRGPLVGHRFATLTKIDPLPEPSPEEDRDVDLTVPAYIQEAAAQGLEYHREGLSGSGVVARTIREATAMSQGNVSEDKVVRASAWAARHRTDLDAEGARPGQDGYPTPGAVAHLLWGIPTGARYADAVAWFDRKSEQVKANRSVGMEVTPVSPRTKGSEVEFRSFTGELRAEGDGMTFSGYAAVFNSPSQPLPFIERIAPGAFSKTLRDRKRDVRLFVNHDSNLVLASRNSGTLRLSEDDRGLRVEADLPNTTAGRDIAELMRTGVVDKMSFGFQVDRRGDKWNEDGTERVLTSVRLFETSIVTGFPAYESTMATVRSLEKLSQRTGIAVGELSEALDLLAEGAELPADKADLLLNAIKQSSPQPEPEPVNLLALKQKQTDLLAKKW
jgi:HK97 family phage prohead protease